MAQGMKGARGFSQMFLVLDVNHSLSLTEAEFVEGLTGRYSGLDDAQLKVVFAEHSACNKMDMHTFIKVVSPGMSDARKEMVKRGFANIDVVKDGIINMEDMKTHFKDRVENHPSYKDGTWSYEKCVEELGGMGYLTDLDGDGDNQITMDEAIAYYETVSGNFPSDTSFERTIKWTFKLP